MGLYSLQEKKKREMQDLVAQNKFISSMSEGHVGAPAHVLHTSFISGVEMNAIPSYKSFQ